MKNLIFSAFLMLVSVVSFSQVNVGFAKAGKMTGGEGIACMSVEDALARFYEGVTNKVVSPFFSERVTIAMQNAGQTFDGRDTLKPSDLVWILGWLKGNLKDTSELHISIYRIPKGNYIFETLTKKSDGSWILGQQITRQSHEGEWILEWFDVRIASSWCLNTFPTVGKVVKPVEVKKPMFSQVPQEENVYQQEETIYKQKVVYQEPVLVQVQVLKTHYDRCGNRGGIGTAYDARKPNEALVVPITLGAFLVIKSQGFIPILSENDPDYWMFEPLYRSGLAFMPVIFDAPRDTDNRLLWGRDFVYLKV
jgi:hypothetical protein